MGRFSVAYWRTGKIMGVATMEDAKLISYCNIVDPECKDCEMCVECREFNEKFGIFPMLTNLVQSEWE